MPGAGQSEPIFRKGTYTGGPHTLSKDDILPCHDAWKKSKVKLESNIIWGWLNHNSA